MAVGCHKFERLDFLSTAGQNSVTAVAVGSVAAADYSLAPVVAVAVGSAVVADYSLVPVVAVVADNRRFP